MNDRRNYTFSIDSPECQICQNYDDCKHKRLVLCKYLEPLTNPAAAEITQLIAEPGLAPHEYRDLKINGTTVTIDLVDIKKKIQDDFYRALKCSFLEGAT